VKYISQAGPSAASPSVRPSSAPANQTTSNSNTGSSFEWTGLVVASLTLLVTILTLGTAVAALFGFSELRKARERAAATQKQMADRLREIEELASLWGKAVQDADARVEATVQSAYGFNQGQEAYSEGNYQRAVDCFRRASKLQPRSTSILCRLGRAYTNLGDPKMAESAFRSALQVDSSCDEAYRGLALADRYDDLDKALEHAQSAAKVGPNDLKNWNCLGLLLRDKGQIDEALKAHERARLIDGRQRITAFYLALLYAAKQRTELAGEYIINATKDLELDESYGRIKPLWAAVLHWARTVFNHDDELASDWAHRAAVSCQSVRRAHEVRGHMLFLLTALGRTGLFDTLPDALKAPQRSQGEPRYHMPEPSKPYRVDGSARAGEPVSPAKVEEPQP
jgi:tetratricopeptide (TPR) repeat protein